MFQIGAINPSVADQRRQELLQKLAQQFSQMQHGSIPGQPGLAPILPMPWMKHKDKASAGAASGAVTGRFHPNARVGGTTITGTSMIQNILSRALGPGGIGRAGAGDQSPAPGVPIPHPSHGAIAAPAAPAAPAPAAPVTPMEQGTAGGAPTNLVHLGNGAFLDTNTGQIHGAGASPQGAGALDAIHALWAAARGF